VYLKIRKWNKVTPIFDKVLILKNTQHICGHYWIRNNNITRKYASTGTSSTCTSTRSMCSSLQLCHGYTQLRLLEPAINSLIYRWSPVCHTLYKFYFSFIYSNGCWREFSAILIRLSMESVSCWLTELLTCWLANRTSTHPVHIACWSASQHVTKASQRLKSASQQMLENNTLDISLMMSTYWARKFYVCSCVSKCTTGSWMAHSLNINMWCSHLPKNQSTYTHLGGSGNY
jgi:hypothetical protein